MNLNDNKVSSDLIGQRKQRLEKVAKLRSLGIDPYPAKSYRNKLNVEITENFDNLKETEVVVAGRLTSLRAHGAIIFADIKDYSGKVQLYIKQDEILDTDSSKQILGYEDLANLTDIGDVIEAKGIVTKTPSGEISVLVKEFRILTKAIRPMPISLDDKEERYRRRYLDMNLHPEVRERFARRAKFWSAIREFLNQNGFVEINIPVLEHTTGGADAKPFITHYDALNEDFYLRISHELPLKRLLGAGYEKVYDIGPRFRNEGFSDEHLPEHVAMEWYWAYADANDGMNFTRDMYRYVMQKVYGTLQFQIKGFDVDLSKEWERIDYTSIIKERFDIDIFNDSLEKMNTILKENGIDLGKDINKNRVIDNLWKIIRKTIAGPAFLVGVPKFMSPLAKLDPQNPELTMRFQPVIAGSEVANAYGELNDPVDQLNRFLEQEELREAGDSEAQMLDIDFVEMLEYGMPPACGFGLSERVFWFFENVTAKEGVPFPQLKYVTDETTKKIYPEINFDEISSQTLIEEKTEAKQRVIQNSDLEAKDQDFSNRIIIVVNNAIEGWQKANTIAHISGYLGNKLKEKFATGENFVTEDGANHPRNSQYAIIIMSANPGQMQNLMQRIREENLLYHGFIREMIETTNDEEIINILKNKSDSEIEYLGIGFYANNEKAKELTKKFSLFK